MSKKPAQPQDKYVLRLPDGLRDRIKTYAERHNRSMNAEIVRILEREFPAPMSMSDRLDQLQELLSALKAAPGKNEVIDGLAETLDETVLGIISGRIKGFDDLVRREVQERYNQFQLERAEIDQFFDYDEEEVEQLGRDGSTAKFVDPFEDKRK